MFRHIDYLQFEAKPEKPDPAYAHKLQELIGGAVLGGDGSPASHRARRRPAAGG